MARSIAITVKQPFRVARVLMEIWQGRIDPIYFLPDSYTVLPLNDEGLAVNVYPVDMECVLTENDQTVEFFYNLLANYFTGTYDAIPVPTTQEQIEKIARREGWRVSSRRKGMTAGIELWVENQILLVLLPEAIATTLPKSSYRTQNRELYNARAVHIKTA